MAEKDTLEILQRVVFGVVATLVLTYGEQKVVLSLIVDEQKIVLIWMLIKERTDDVDVIADSETAEDMSTEYGWQKMMLV